MAFPCSDYEKNLGVVFFPRMLDKIRMQAAGTLPEGYNVGFSLLNTFDARFCRFWEVDFEEIKAKTLEGASNEEVFRYAFRNRKMPNDDQILVWNGFLLKRGWRDSAGLQADKEAGGFGDRDDILTYVTLHDIEEGREPQDFVG